MTSKLILIGIAISSIGIVALPQTLALFAGQHNFYDTIEQGPDAVPCGKCHADIYAELTQPGSVNSEHLKQGCDGCHITAPVDKESLTQGGGINMDFHAAAAPACLDCHSGTGPGKDARSILVGPEEVHRPFALEANSSNLLKSSNEACIACHTHVAVDINWTKGYKISFNAMEFIAIDGTHNWTVNNFAAEGTAVVQTYGNMSGQINSSTYPPVISLPAPTPINFDINNP